MSEKKPVRAVLDSEYGFQGYLIGDVLFSSLRTVPDWAKDDAATELLERREAIEAEARLPWTERPDDLHVELDLALDRQKKTAKVGRPTQVTCKAGHPLKNAYVDSRGKRQCRTCNAERNRLAREAKQVPA